MSKSGRVSRGTSAKPGSKWGEGEFANMPKEAEMAPYPKSRPAEKDLDDTISGIDSWSDQMMSKRNKYVSDQH